MKLRKQKNRASFHSQIKALKSELFFFPSQQSLHFFVVAAVLPQNEMRRLKRKEVKLKFMSTSNKFHQKTAARSLLCFGIIMFIVLAQAFDFLLELSSLQSRTIFHLSCANSGNHFPRSLFTPVNATIANSLDSNHLAMNLCKFFNALDDYLFFDSSVDMHFASNF